MPILRERVARPMLSTESPALRGTQYSAVTSMLHDDGLGMTHNAFRLPAFHQRNQDGRAHLGKMGVRGEGGRTNPRQRPSALSAKQGLGNIPTPAVYTTVDVEPPAAAGEKTSAVAVPVAAPPQAAPRKTKTILGLQPTVFIVLVIFCLIFFVGFGMFALSATKHKHNHTQPSASAAYAASAALRGDGAMSSISQIQGGGGQCSAPSAMDDYAAFMHSHAEAGQHVFGS